MVRSARLQYSRWHSSYNTSISKRASYNSTSSYYALITYMHSRKNDNARTYPAIIAYYDGFLWFGSLLVDRNVKTIKLIACGHHHHIWSHHHIFTYSDITIEASITSQLASGTNRQTCTIAEITMILYYHVFATMTQQMPYTPISQSISQLIARHRLHGNTLQKRIINK